LTVQKSAALAQQAGGAATGELQYCPGRGKRTGGTDSLNQKRQVAPECTTPAPAPPRLRLHSLLPKLRPSTDGGVTGQADP